MKLLFLITRADSFGGSSVHVRDMSRRLMSAGHQVLVAIGGRGPVTEALERAGVSFEVIPDLVREVSVPRDIRATLQLRRVIRHFRPDLVSTHTAKAGTLGRFAAWSCEVPVLYTPHCWSFGKVSSGGRAFRWIERLACPFGNRVICVSEDERQVGLQARIGTPKQLTTVHNGMPDIAKGLIANAAGSPPTVLMVGRFEEQKDHKALISALAGIRDIPWRLKLVGDGPLENECRALVAELGVAGQVEFMGFRTDVAEIMAGVQIYALVSHWEGFARSIVEALRAGLPVVASDVGGNREAVADSVNGFITAPGSAAELRARVGELLGSASLRSAMGKASRRRYEREFTFEAMFAKTMRVYSEVTGKDWMPAAQATAAEETVKTESKVFAGPTVQ